MQNLAPEALRDLEQAIIGAVLLDASTIDILPALDSGHFFDLRARSVWEAFTSIRLRGEAIDMVTLETQLSHDQLLDAVGFVYLGECALRCPTPDNTVDYARLVRDAALDRATRVAAAELLQIAQRGDAHGSDLLGRAMEMFSALDADEVKDDSQTIKQLVRQRIKQLEDIAAQGGVKKLTGAPTGVEGLDRVTGGWQFGIVSVIAARPSMGKSSLGLATTDACTAGGYGVHTFSLEDTRDSYTDRVLSRMSGIPASSIRKCELTRGQMQDFSAAQAKLWQRKGWLVDDRSGIGAQDIVRTVRRHRKANGTRVVIVDYLQLLKRHPDAQSKHESIGDNLHILADAAKNDGMAYVVMSQLNREIEKRPDKRPTMADMRESGTIEERAKCVVGLYRGSVYGGMPKAEIDVDEEGRTMDADRWMKTAQVIVLKQNNGVAPHTVLANWRGETTEIW